MKKIGLIIVLVVQATYLFTQKQTYVVFFSNSDYSLFVKEYNSYPKDFKVFDTITNINYLSICYTKQHNDNTEIEYELMPFNFFKSKLIIKELPEDP